MTQIKLNDKQKLAIESNSREILISASAGTGKTTVLVEKVKKLVLQNKIPLQSLLIITFTNNSAQHLRKKIKEVFEKELLKRYDSFIEEQLLHLGNSDICTFHTFFNKILKKYSNELGLSSKFKIISENDLKVLHEDVLDKLISLILKEHKKNGSYTVLLNYFYNKNNLFMLKQTILKVYLKIRTYDNLKSWIYKSIENYSKEENLEFIWTEIYKNNFEILKKLIEKLNKLITNIRALNIYQKHLNFLDNIREKLLNILNNSNIDMNIENLKNFQTGMWPRINNKESDSVLDNYYNSYLLFKKELNYFIDTLDNKKKFFKQQQQQKNLIEEFILALNKFDSIIFESKIKKNVLDFTDLEIFTLKLLSKNKHVKYEINRSIKAILIDEYQDTSNIQENIMNLLRNKETQIFMVGDLKQSIYGFRESNPDIFCNKRIEYLQKNNNSKLVALNENYRSNDDILYFNNIISNYIFSKYNFYDKNIDNFIVKKNINFNSNNNIEYIFYKEDKVDKNNNKYSKQVNAIVDKIKMLLYADCDNNVGSKFKLSDIAIISRRRNKELLDLLQDKLDLENISYNLDINKNLFKINEIIDIISMLQILQNINNDNYLFIFLKSLFCNISDIELYEIFKNKEETNLCNKLLTYISCNNNALAIKIKKKLEDIEYYKKIINNTLLSDAILEILNITSFFEKVANKENGINIINNVKNFIQIAKDYENNYNSLYFFNNYVNKFLENDYYIPSNKSFYNNNNDSLNILTIHKSKGLEFPIVFLIDLETKFNDVDTKDVFQLDNDYGITFRQIDYENKVKYKTVFYEFINNRNKRKKIEEEYRLLYVACTRPKDKLCIFLDCNNLNKQIPKKSFQSFSEVFINIYNDYNLYFKSILLNEKLYNHCGQSNRNIYNKKNENLSIDNLMFYKKLINFKYENWFLQNYPVKVTVSQLNQKKHISNKTEEKIIDYSSLYKDPPSLNYNKILNSAIVGQIYHFILENYSWDKAPIKETINNLVKENKIPESFKKQEVVEKLNKVVYIIREKYIKNNYNVISKEIPFSLLKSAKYIYKEEERFNNEKVLIQGKIDLLLCKDNKYVIIDFKTSNKKIDILNKDYYIQMSLYKEAVKKKFNCQKIFCEIIQIK